MHTLAVFLVVAMLVAPSDATAAKSQCFGLQQKLSFMKGKPWVRHDEHYHVDFALACKPIAK